MTEKVAVSKIKSTPGDQLFIDDKNVSWFWGTFDSMIIQDLEYEGTSVDMSMCNMIDTVQGTVYRVGDCYHVEYYLSKNPGRVFSCPVACAGVVSEGSEDEDEVQC